ncbi:MalY/PatB family protein [Bacteroidota bacterium]
MKYDFDEVIERRNTNSVKYDYTTKYFDTDDLIPMWVADMDFRTPDFIMEAIRERAGHEILGYSVRPDSFFQAVINWYKDRQGWEIQRDWILFSPGIVAALSMAVRAYSNEGDKIIVQPPVYHPFFSVIKENKRIPLYNPLLEKNGDYRMDFEGLKEKLDPSVKLLLLSHPHNPVGRVWSEDELDQLARICIENNIIMLSDEIHSDLVFNPHRHKPLCTIGEEIAQNTITCVAPSKTFNLAGLSSSVVVIQNEELRARFNHELATGHLNMGNIFGSVALEAAYAKGHEWLDQLMEYLKGNLDLLGRFIESDLPGIRMYPAEATYLAWLDMKDLGLKSKELRQFMIRNARIGCNDGPSFGPGGEGFQRLNFACPRSVLQKALAQLKDALEARN